MVKVYSLNLSTSTTSGVYACTTISSGDYSNINFNINWDDIFKGQVGHAKLKFQLCSKSSTSYTFNADMGYVNLNGIASPYSNSCNIGLIRPMTDTTSTYTLSQVNSTSTVLTGTTTYINGLTTSNAPKQYLYGNSCDTSGISVLIPQGYNQLNIQLLDIDSKLISTTDPFLLWLYFEVNE
jgi:hypothetical protein